MTILLLLLLLGAAGYCWWRLVLAREKARAAAGMACREHGLVLMDDTVVLDALDTTRWKTHRVIGLQYRFDFAHKGILQQGGKVMIAPRQRVMVILSTPEGQVIETV